jgi:RNA polymerase sigma-19 factor, ECF subfamily
VAKHDRIRPDFAARSDIDLTARIDDQLLVERVRAGDPLVFEAIFRRYHRELCAVAQSIVGSRVAADDVVQDVFLAVWKLRHSWSPNSVRMYLRRATRNVALRDASRPGVARVEGLSETGAELVDSAPTPQQHAEAAELAQEEARAADKFPPRVREVYRLSRESGLSTRQIAEQLHLSPKTVEAHLTRALALLRSALAKWLRD